MGCCISKKKVQRQLRQNQQINNLLNYSNVLQKNLYKPQLLKLLEFISSDIFQQKNKITLAYRASEHKLQVKYFYQICSKLSSMLIIGITSNNVIFGAFVNCKWPKIQGYTYAEDYSEKSFLFSFKYKTQKKVQTKKQQIKRNTMKPILFSIKNTEKSLTNDQLSPTKSIPKKNSNAFSKKFIDYQNTNKKSTEIKQQTKFIDYQNTNKKSTEIKQSTKLTDYQNINKKLIKRRQQCEDNSISIAIPKQQEQIQQAPQIIVGQFEHQNIQSNIKLFKIRSDKRHKALQSHAKGIIFGDGHDLFLADECDKNFSWSNIGRTYNCVQSFGSKQANMSLTGQKQFLVNEYEVWTINQ